MRRAHLPLALALTLVSASAFGAVITVVNADGPNTGFNDTTAAQPIGGNSGTTLGQQRMNVFRKAAEIWGDRIYSDVEIIVEARFAPIIRNDSPCTADAAILGFAGAQRFESNFTNAPQANIRYPIALANKFAGRDLRPGEPDIFAQFNAEVDSQTCLGASDWYYGYDANEGTDQDLLAVVLHEIAHGLGMSGSVSDLAVGTFPGNLPSVYSQFIFDRALGLHWSQMTPQQRVASAISDNVVWDGNFARSAALRFLNTAVVLSLSGARDGTVAFGPASFGANIENISASGRIVAPNDGTAPTSDGCTPYTNAAAIRGNWALVDRGQCEFGVKALNAQQAGAVGIIIVDNVSTCTQLTMGPGVTNPALVTIPVIGIRQVDGNALKAQLAAGIDAHLFRDPSRRAGASPEGYPELYAPCVLEPGSSIHHWDTDATPNLLMEPAINPDLDHLLDITPYQLNDIGWGQQATTGRRVLRR